MRIITQIYRDRVSYADYPEGEVQCRLWKTHSGVPTADERATHVIQREEGWNYVYYRCYPEAAQ